MSADKIHCAHRQAGACPRCLSELVNESREFHAKLLHLEALYMVACGISFDHGRLSEEQVKLRSANRILREEVCLSLRDAADESDRHRIALALDAADSAALRA